MARLILFFCMCLLSINMYSDSLIRLNYNDGFTLYFSCENISPTYFYYEATKDNGNLDRADQFFLDDQSPGNLPKYCRQSSTKSYKTNIGNITYDRGHLVPANHLDHDKMLIRLSNRMANIVPMASSLNRYGLWRHTEVLTECYRDLGRVKVWGGVIFNNNDNDHFIESHGIRTPDYLWKIIQFPNQEIQAFLMPNNNLPKKNSIQYIVSPAHIKKLTGIKFGFNAYQMVEVDRKIMKKPKFCNLG